jgi:uncharacterized protein YcnI
VRRLGLPALVLAAAFAGPAAAHVQVLPSTVAPGDPTLFTVLVPNESNSETVKVELKIPDGVIPFSFEEAPGWRRVERLAADQSLDVVEWSGALPPGEFVRFSFLAATPEAEGEIAWPAVQSYEDGTKVRWIGGPGSEEPAAITVVSRDAPRQNAGGEGSTVETAPAGDGATVSAPAGSPEPASTEPAGESRALEIVALALGAGALLLAAVALARSRRGA